MSSRRRVRDLYLRIMASSWGFRVFGRAVPSAFFLVGFLGGLDHLPDVTTVLREPTLGRVLALLDELLARFLGLCLVVLFAIRKPVIGRPASLLGAVVALAASFYGAFVIFFNTLGIRRPAPSDDPLVTAIGLGLNIAAATLLAISYVNLGRHIGIFPEVRGLVTSGPYRYLRHPIYVAYLLGAAASAVSTLSIQSALIFVAFYGMVAWRASLEERALEEVFGEQYRRYKESSLGLVPRQRLRGQRSTVGG